MSSSVSLVCIDPARISEFWPHAKHFIKQAINETSLSEFDAIEHETLQGKQLLWLAWSGQSIEAAATTALCPPVCVLTACGGYLRERWVSLLDHIEQYARNEGCKTMRIFGRRGWERVLDGYRADYVILQKDL